MKTIKKDVIIVGTGVSGLFAALNLPRDKEILMVTKDTLDHSDSYLAQGGICVLPVPEDYDNFMEDTLRAGHYENRRESVDIMIRSSQDTIRQLIGYGVEFAHDPDGTLSYTREGAHSRPRILFHADITGEEITSKLLSQVQRLPNVTLLEYTTLVDIIEEDNCCMGVVLRSQDGTLTAVEASDTLLATGGIGGLYEHSTNYPHLTGDALAIALRHGITLEHLDYIQIHPTTLYSPKPGRRFLISESVRGEGAVLLDKDGNRFTDELLPRDLLSARIHKQMEKDHTPYVQLCMKDLGRETIQNHFPHIYEHCLREGYDVTKECIPVVPAQHYFMGGIWVDTQSKTSMDHLYASGETSCNGVHGANRLASNSLLESLVFAKRAALLIAETPSQKEKDPSVHFTRLAQKTDPTLYSDSQNLASLYRHRVLQEIERMRQENE